MQVKKERRSNSERTEATRAALLKAARKLFVQKGYAETGTPEIVAAAEVTRGALYHHFADKMALFRAVVEQEASQVAELIDRRSVRMPTVRESLAAGGDAYFEAMAEPGRVRLLLLDGPSVLGHAEMDRIDGAAGRRTLREGLAAGIESGELQDLPIDAATAMLSAAYDRAALAIAHGEREEHYKTIIERLIDGISTRNESG